MSPIVNAEAFFEAATSDREMEKRLHKLLELIQQEIDAGCKHCSWILGKVFEKEAE